MQAGRPEGLVGVDVADAGEERLVEEERLEATLGGLGAGAASRGRVNAGSSGSGPKPAKPAAPPSSP